MTQDERTAREIQLIQESEAKQIAAAVAADRARCQSILDSKLAVGREGLAKNLAYRCNMSLSDAEATLRVAPSGEEQQDQHEPIDAKAMAWDKAARQAMRVDDDDDEFAGQKAAKRLLGKTDDDDEGDEGRRRREEDGESDTGDPNDRDEDEEAERRKNTPGKAKSAFGSWENLPTQRELQQEEEGRAAALKFKSNGYL